MARLKEQYVNEIAPALNKKFGYKSVMQIPKLDKVIINVAAGEAKENAKVIDAIVADLGQITGQKAIVCKARKSVANFKLREGMPIGAKVTLRGERMYEFVDRLFNVALPRVRDFRGINGNSFDGRGNYAFGLKEQIIFPEIDFDKVDAIRGMDICFVTTAKTDEEAKELLAAEAGVGAVALVLVEIFLRQLIALFGAANESVYYTDFAVRSFRIYLCMIILACVNKACFIFLQAMGKAGESTALSMVREVVFGVGFALLLPHFFGLDGVLYSMPLSDILTFLIAVYLIVKTYRGLEESHT